MQHLTSADLEKTIRDARAHASTCEGKHVFVFLGPTGAGKTTFIRHLLGHRLGIVDFPTEVDGVRGPPRSLIDVDARDYDPRFIIGHDGSQTRHAMMAQWDTDDGCPDDHYLVDLPGLRDAGDAERVSEEPSWSRILLNLSNAVQRTHILRHAASVRLVVVIQHEQLHVDRGGALSDQLAEVEGLFRDFTSAIRSTAVLVGYPKSCLRDLLPSSNRFSPLLHLGEVFSKVRQIVQRQKDTRPGNELLRHIDQQLRTSAIALENGALDDLRAYVMNPLESNDERHIVRRMLHRTPALCDPTTFRTSIDDSVITAISLTLNDSKDRIMAMVRAIDNQESCTTEEMRAVAEHTRHCLLVADMLSKLDLDCRCSTIPGEVVLALQKMNDSLFANVVAAIENRNHKFVAPYVEVMTQLDDFLRDVRTGTTPVTRDALPEWKDTERARSEGNRILRDQYKNVCETSADINALCNALATLRLLEIAIDPTLSNSPQVEFGQTLFQHLMALQQKATVDECKDNPELLGRRLDEMKLAEESEILNNVILQRNPATSARKWFGDAFRQAQTDLEVMHKKIGKDIRGEGVDVTREEWLNYRSRLNRLKDFRGVMQKRGCRAEWHDELFKLEGILQNLDKPAYKSRITIAIVVALLAWILYPYVIDVGAKCRTETSTKIRITINAVMTTYTRVLKGQTLPTVIFPLDFPDDIQKLCSCRCTGIGDSCYCSTAMTSVLDTLSNETDVLEQNLVKHVHIAKLKTTLHFYHAFLDTRVTCVVEDTTDMHLIRQYENTTRKRLQRFEERGLTPFVSLVPTCEKSGWVLSLPSALKTLEMLKSYLPDQCEAKLFEINTVISNCAQRHYVALENASAYDDLGSVARIWRSYAQPFRDSSDATCKRAGEYMFKSVAKLIDRVTKFPSDPRAQHMRAEFFEHANGPCEIVDLIDQHINVADSQIDEWITRVPPVPAECTQGNLAKLSPRKKMELVNATRGWISVIRDAVETQTPLSEVEPYILSVRALANRAPDLFLNLTADWDKCMTLVHAALASAKSSFLHALEQGTYTDSKTLMLLRASSSFAFVMSNDDNCHPPTVIADCYRQHLDSIRNTLEGLTALSITPLEVSVAAQTIKNFIQLASTEVLYVELQGMTGLLGLFWSKVTTTLNKFFTAVHLTEQALCIAFPPDFITAGELVKFQKDIIDSMTTSAVFERFRSSIRLLETKTSCVHTESEYVIQQCKEIVDSPEKLLSILEGAVNLTQERKKELVGCIKTTVSTTQSRNDKAAYFQDWGKKSTFKRAFEQCRKELLREFPPELGSISKGVDKYVNDNKKWCSDNAEILILKIVGRFRGLQVDAQLCNDLRTYHAISGLTSNPVADEKRISDARNSFWTNLDSLLVEFQRSVNDLRPGFNFKDFVSLASRLSHLKTEDFHLLGSSQGEDDIMTQLSVAMEGHATRLATVPSLLNNSDYTQVSSLFTYTNELHKYFDQPFPDLRVPNFPTSELKTFAHDMTTTAQGAWKEGKWSEYDAPASQLLTLVQAFSGVSGDNDVIKEIRGYHTDMEKLVRAFFDTEATKAQSVDNIELFARSLIRLKQIGFDAPIVATTARNTIEAAVKDFLRRNTANPQLFVALGSELLRHERVGVPIVKEHSKYFAAANLEIFRRTTEGKLLVDECINGLEAEPEIPTATRERLRALLKLHEGTLEQAAVKYIASMIPFHEARAGASLDLSDSVQRAKNHPSPQHLAEVAIRVSVLFTLFTSHQTFGMNTRADALVRLHAAQIMTIFRLLSCDSDDSSFMDYWTSLKSKLGLQNEMKFHNHVAQILTGQGKSYTLGVLAVVFAVMDIRVDVACYSDYLMQRDYATLSPFFEFVGMKSSIRYMTFEKLLESRIEGLRDAALSIFTNGSTPILPPSSAPVADRYVLLIDEVDIFFAERFYGGVYDPAVMLQCDEVTALIKLAYQHRGQDAFDILTSIEMNAVLAKYPPELGRVLKNCARTLMENSKHFDKMPYEYSDEKKSIGYKLQHSTEIDYAVRFPNLSVFVYLHLFATGRISDPTILAQNVGIDLSWSQFSYAEIPKKQYSGIFGVTGTLSNASLSTEELSILKDDYNVQVKTYTPSVYGTSRCEFNFLNHVTFHDSSAKWMAAIEKEASERSKLGGSVLIYFSNSSVLQQFVAERPLMKSAHILTEKTVERDGIIMSATQPGTITLSTRDYGRGVDFIPITGVVVTVLQTFYSVSLSEQVQIGGRTCRQGNDGHYRMLLCIEHLVAELNVDSAELAVRRSKVEGQMYLEEKRSARLGHVMKQLRQRKETAKALDQEAWTIVKSLRGKDNAATLKLLVGASLRRMFHPTLFLIVLDVSGSMDSPMSQDKAGGTRWAALLEAHRDLLRELLDNRGGGSDTFIAEVFFSTDAKENSFGRIGSTPALPTSPPGGGTNFVAAFSKCDEILSRPDAKDYDVTLLFLTDGEATDSPMNDVHKLLKNHASHISNFFAINVNTVTPDILTTITQAFESKGVRSQLVVPGSKAELSDVFKTVAHAQPIHTKSGNE